MGLLKIKKELNKLKEYRALFNKIAKSDLKLEYTGGELIMYRNEIENELERNMRKNNKND